MKELKFETSGLDVIATIYYKDCILLVTPEPRMLGNSVDIIYNNERYTRSDIEFYPDYDTWKSTPKTEEELKTYVDRFLEDNTLMKKVQHNKLTKQFANN